jgi:hypothetical protein
VADCTRGKFGLSSVPHARARGRFFRFVIGNGRSKLDRINFLIKNSPYSHIADANAGPIPCRSPSGVTLAGLRALRERLPRRNRRHRHELESHFPRIRRRLVVGVLGADPGHSDPVVGGATPKPAVRPTTARKSTAPSCRHSSPPMLVSTSPPSPTKPVPGDDTVAGANRVIYSDATCKSCGACARRRDTVIGLLAHGAWRQVEKATAARDVPVGDSWAFHDHRTLAEVIAAEPQAT